MVLLLRSNPRFRPAAPASPEHEWWFELNQVYRYIIIRLPTPLTLPLCPTTSFGQKYHLHRSLRRLWCSTLRSFNASAVSWANHLFPSLDCWEWRRRYWIMFFLLQAGHFQCSCQSPICRSDRHMRDFCQTVLYDSKSFWWADRRRSPRWRCLWMSYA